MSGDLTPEQVADWLAAQGLPKEANTVRALLPAAPDANGVKEPPKPAKAAKA